MVVTRVTRRLGAAVVAMSLGGFVGSLGSGVAQAEAEPGRGSASPITVTTLHGPNGEPLEAPSPLAERPARALNERGQVVATIGSDILGRGDVVLWDQGVATRISPEGVKVAPTDISDIGQVVGDCDPQRDLAACASPFSWENGEWRSLPVPDGTLGAARAVNNVGQVVGFLTVYSSEGVTSKVKVVAWSGDELVEAPVDIEVTGHRPVEAVDINDRGQALFNVFDYNTGESTAYLWDVGGGVAEIESVEAVAVNNRGQVVGRALAGDGYHAFLWEDGEMTDLGALLEPAPPGAIARFSSGIDINDRGQIVGSVATLIDFSTPFMEDVTLWTLPSRR